MLGCDWVSIAFDYDAIAYEEGSPQPSSLVQTARVLIVMIAQEA